MTQQPSFPRTTPVMVRLADDDDDDSDDETTRSTSVVRTRIKPSGRNGNPLTVGEWARAIVEDNPEWLLRISRRAARHKFSSGSGSRIAHGGVLMSFGCGFDSLVVLGGEKDFPKDLAKVDRVCVGVCVALVGDGEDGTRLDRYGRILPSELIAEHVPNPPTTAHILAPENDVCIYLHTNITPFRRDESQWETLKLLRVFPREDDPFVVDRLETVSVDKGWKNGHNQNKRAKGSQNNSKQPVPPTGKTDTKRPKQKPGKQQIRLGFNPREYLLLSKAFNEELTDTDLLQDGGTFDKEDLKAAKRLLQQVEKNDEEVASKNIEKRSAEAGGTPSSKRQKASSTQTPKTKTPTPKGKTKTANYPKKNTGKQDVEDDHGKDAPNRVAATKKSKTPAQTPKTKSPAPADKIKISNRSEDNIGLGFNPREYLLLGKAFNEELTDTDLAQDGSTFDKEDLKAAKRLLRELEDDSAKDSSNIVGKKIETTAVGGTPSSKRQKVAVQTPKNKTPVTTAKTKKLNRPKESTGKQDIGLGFNPREYLLLGKAFNEELTDMDLIQDGSTFDKEDLKAAKRLLQQVEKEDEEVAMNFMEADVAVRTSKNKQVTPSAGEAKSMKVPEEGGHELHVGLDFNPREYLLLGKAFNEELTEQDLVKDGSAFTKADLKAAKELLQKVEDEDRIYALNGSNEKSTAATESPSKKTPRTRKTVPSSGKIKRAKHSEDGVEKHKAGDETPTVVNETPVAATPSKKDSKTNRRPWTVEEKSAVKEGVKKFGIGAWTKTKLEYAEILQNRTNIQIKDAWRHMLKKGEVEDCQEESTQMSKDGKNEGVATSTENEKDIKDSTTKERGTTAKSKTPSKKTKPKSKSKSPKKSSKKEAKS